ncbi:MAG TPA: TRAP transporter small permease [Rhodocyclaceae bacterium]|nr:TRAP transporter small permease [Rhodocyclaceae bacterium]
MSDQTWARYIYRTGQTVGALSAAAVVLLTISDVVLRYFFNKAIFGSDEITNSLLGVLVGAGLIVAAGMRIHISVDLFDAPMRRRFPSAYPRWIRMSELLGTFALAALLTRHAWNSIVNGELTAVLEFPIGWVYAAIAVQVIGALAVLASGWRPPFAAEDEHQ